MYPILAIDFGQKHIGIAISDSKGLIASPLPVLNITKNRDIEIIIDDIIELAKEYRVKSFLVGYPQEFDTSHKINTTRIDAFINSLKTKTQLQILTTDESFSTSSAKNMLISLDQNFKKGKKKIDSIAATIFLQEYLDNNENN